MLKNIDFQTSSDELIQKQYEAQMSPLIQRRLARNLQAFASFDIELAQKLSSHHSVTFSPFVTKSRRLNVMSISKGRALYDFIPEKQVALQVTHFRKCALLYKPADQRSVLDIFPSQGASLNSLLPKGYLVMSRWMITVKV